MKVGWLMEDEWMWDAVGVGINQLARRNFCSLPLKQAVTQERKEGMGNRGRETESNVE